MNQTITSILVGLVAGVGGAFTFHLLQGGGEGVTAGLEADGPAGESLRSELLAIKAELAALRNPPETLTSRASPGGAASAPGVSAVAGDPAAVEALLARIDERVGEAVEKKLEASDAAGEGGPTGRRGRRSRKRVSLADAARELEFTAQQEDELRRIYEDSQNRFFKLMAAEGEDPEEVRREVMEAAKTPGGPQKLIPKYLPRMIPKLGEVMSIEADRQAAIQKTVGPDKARRLQSDFSVEEDDPLGFRGGGGMSFGVEARSGN